MLALVLQHLCITLVALSLIRERTSGILELYRVGPTSAWEIVTAKIVSYLVIGGVIAGASFLFILFALQEPFLGPPASVLTVIVMLLVSSIGIGLLVAVLSDSERMAVQASLLFLLASIFFSGFVIDLEPVQQARADPRRLHPGDPRDRSASERDAVRLGARPAGDRGPVRDRGRVDHVRLAASPTPDGRPRPDLTLG